MSEWSGGRERGREEDMGEGDRGMGEGGARLCNEDGVTGKGEAEEGGAKSAGET